MHIVTRPREEIITVKFNSRVFEVRMTSDGAFVPEDLGAHMVARGLVAKGQNPDPRPRWEALPGGAHGDLIPPYQPWVKEVPKSDVDETATPEAVARILEKGKAK